MTETQLRNAMETYGDTVYRLALCRMQNVADAEDVYQDVFLRLFAQSAMDWGGEHLKAWLIRATLNRCADVHRFRLRRPVLSLEELPDMARIFASRASASRPFRSPLTKAHYGGRASVLGARSRRPLTRRLFTACGWRRTSLTSVLLTAPRCG